MLTSMLAVVSLIWAAAAALPAQNVVLPADMKPAFRRGSVWAETIWLPVAAQDAAIRGQISFHHSEVSGEVEFFWIFKTSGAAAGTLSQTVQTSFQPLAVARRAATTDTLNVVGWSARTGRVLVETWTLGEPLLAAAATPGQPSISGMSTPAVTRVIEWVSDAGQLPPVWDAAWQMHSGRLLLLTRGSPPEVPTAVWALDPATGQLDLVCDAGTSDGLEGRRRLVMGLHPTGGLVASLTRRRPWDHARVEPKPVTYFVLRDGNGDGQFDFMGLLSQESRVLMFPSPWVGKYEEP